MTTARTPAARFGFTSSATVKKVRIIDDATRRVSRSRSGVDGDIAVRDDALD